MAAPTPSAKTRLLSAAVKLVRTQGYGATTVDELCREAGVTKGAFFHYFRSKEELGVAATSYWNEMLENLFATAPYNQYEDPLDRLLGYLDYRSQLIDGENLAERTCLLGTVVQETFATHPTLRDACSLGITHHANYIRQLLEDAKQRHAPDATWSADSIATHCLAVIQGGFILAKAENQPKLAVESIRHLRHYIQLLFRHGIDDRQTF